MKQLSFAPVDPTDVMEKIKSLSHGSTVQATSFLGGGGDLSHIATSISDIQNRLRPKRALPDRMKRMFFFFRIPAVERGILAIYHLLTKDQREISYHLTLVCQDLLQANLILQAKVAALPQSQKSV